MTEDRILLRRRAIRTIQLLIDSAGIIRSAVLLVLLALFL